MFLSSFGFKLSPKFLSIFALAITITAFIAVCGCPIQLHAEWIRHSIVGEAICWTLNILLIASGTLLSWSFFKYLCSGSGVNLAPALALTLLSLAFIGIFSAIDKEMVTTKFPDVVISALWVDAIFLWHWVLEDEKAEIASRRSAKKIDPEHWRHEAINRYLTYRQNPAQPSDSDGANG